MTARRRHAAPLRRLLASLLVFAAPATWADAGWFEAGDSSLRIDLQLLNDAEIIRLPISHWPLPRIAVKHAMSRAKEHYATNAAVRAALARVRARLDANRGLRFEGRGSVGEPALLRSFDTLARESAELGGRAAWSGDRAEVRLAVAGVVDPADDQSIRADGSHATLKLGNWLLSAHTLDRWWGPGHDGSLILSSNARPMPSVQVERAAAMPFENRWLGWLGPWRFSFALSRMEDERLDIDSPLFMAWRVVVMPFHDIELGFSRTAQFCGETLECDADSFLDLLIGNDNVGIDVAAGEEPGNQMAGFDIRWNSPLGSWPYAVYSQMIGEDESSYLPAKYLSQHGVEVWRPYADGDLLQVYAEYSSTTCSANSGSGPYYNCAYNQGLFNVEGYRYRGRVIGYTSDRDAENYSLGATLSRADGSQWSAMARQSRFNRDDFVDVENSVSPVPATYYLLEAGWRGSLFGEQVSVEVGVESLEPANGERDIAPYGFISWRHEFRP